MQPRHLPTPTLSLFFFHPAPPVSSVVHCVSVPISQEETAAVERGRKAQVCFHRDPPSMDRGLLSLDEDPPYPAMDTSLRSFLSPTPRGGFFKDFAANAKFASMFCTGPAFRIREDVEIESQQGPERVAFGEDGSSAERAGRATSCVAQDSEDEFRRRGRSVSKQEDSYGDPQRRRIQSGDGDVVIMPTAPLTVLLAEDDSSTRQVVSALLRNCGYEVLSVANGQDAWDILQDSSRHVDLVLAEVFLHCISGIELLRRIMAHALLERIPVVMMSSSHDSMGLVFKCLSLGAVDFLIKPIRKNELKNIWQHVWRRNHSSSGNKCAKGGSILENEHKSGDIGLLNNTTGSSFEHEDTGVVDSEDDSDNGTQGSRTYPDSDTLGKRRINSTSQIKLEARSSSTTGVCELVEAEEAVLPETGSNEKSTQFSAEALDLISTIIQNKKSHACVEECNYREEPTTNKHEYATESSETGLLPILNLSPKRQRGMDDIRADDSKILRRSVSSAFSRYTNGQQMHADRIQATALSDGKLSGDGHAMGKLCSEFTVQRPESHCMQRGDVVTTPPFLTVAGSQPTGLTYEVPACHPALTSKSSFAKDVFPPVLSPVPMTMCPPPAFTEPGSYQHLFPFVYYSHPGVPVPYGAMSCSSVDQQGSCNGVPGLEPCDSHFDISGCLRYPYFIHYAQPASELSRIASEPLPHKPTPGFPHSGPSTAVVKAQQSSHGCASGKESSNGADAVCNQASRGKRACDEGLVVLDKSCITTGAAIAVRKEEEDPSARRRSALLKFQQKRSERCFEKKVRYESRKRLAEQRPRERGQFVKRAA